MRTLTRVVILYIHSPLVSLTDGTQERVSLPVFTINVMNVFIMGSDALDGFQSHNCEAHDNTPASYLVNG